MVSVKFRKVITYLSFSLAIIFFLSCSDDNDKYKVEVNKSSIDLNSNHTKQELQIISSGSWGIEAQGLDRYIGTPRA